MLKRTCIISSVIIFCWNGFLLGQLNEKRTLSETSHQIYHVSYSPDGKFIATTGSDNNILLWNAESGIIYRTLVGLKKRPNRVVFSADGKHIFSAGEDGILTCWDPQLVQITSSTPKHSGAIKALDINPDGTVLASAGEDKIIRVWGIAEGYLTLIYELKGHRKTITTLAFSPDGQTLVSGGADKILMKWDLQNGINTGSIQAHEGWIRCAAFSPDGLFIATGGDDNLVKIRKAKDFTLHKTLKGHTDWVQTLDYTNTGNYIISGGHDRHICFWDVHTSKMVDISKKLEHIVVSLDSSPIHNDVISSCLLSEQLRIWAHGYGAAADSDLLIPNHILPDKVETSPSQPDGSDPAVPSITLFSPEPVNGEVIHENSNILIIGKAEGLGGIQTVLVNRQRTVISESGVFQLDLELSTGDNQIELVAVTNKGKMNKYSFVIHCNDENASKTGTRQVAIDQGKYHALIIAVNEYGDDRITDLDYPIADADNLNKILTNLYSFHENNIYYLKNPNRTDIIIALDELSRSVTANDNLLIFYAGHGNWDEKSGVGYWLPHDAARSNTANWFRNSTLRDFIGSIQSRHTLLIADACFSGSIFKTRAGFKNEGSGIQKLHDLPSRKAMTSGALKEVPDKSVFVKYLIQELHQNQAKFLSSAELFSNFKTAVLNNSPNVPQYGTIQNVGDEGGDFIFRKK